MRRRAAQPGTPPVPREAWLRLAACAAAAALLQIDGTVVTVALPSVSSELDVGSHTVAWVLTAYFAAYALALFPGGWLVDRYGTRAVTFAGLALFAAGLVAGALAGSFEMLVASRVVQGAGAGLVSPASLAGAVGGFPPERRGAALGIWGASSGAANLVGPLLGGVLTQLIDWRACWWALLVLSGVVAVLVARFVPTRPEQQVDETIGPLGGKRVIRAATLVAGLTFVVMIGTFFIAQIYLQQVVGYTAIGASAALVVVALLVAVGAPLAGRLADTYGERAPALAGFLLTGAALAVLGIPGAPLHGIGALPLLCPVGLGLGMLFVPASRAALNSVPVARHGRVSAVLSFARLTGAALGSGLAGLALAQGVTTGHVHRALLVAALICLLAGLPAAAQLGGAAPRAPETAPSPL